MTIINDENISFFDRKDVPKFLKYSGRLFIDYKIITFWDFPENKEKLKEIIKDLENELNIKIWNNGWEIEIIENYLNKKYLWENDFEKINYIPVEEYKGSEDFSEEKRKKHIESPLFKKSDKIKNFGSLSYKGKQPLSWKQAKLKSENLITNFNFFINEGLNYHLFKGVNGNVFSSILNDGYIKWSGDWESSIRKSMGIEYGIIKL